MTKSPLNAVPHDKSSAEPTNAASGGVLGTSSNISLATCSNPAYHPGPKKKAESQDALANFRNVIMKGSICCNRCGRPMQENGVCSQCNTASCHIQLYWKRPYKFYKDRKGISYGYSSALAALIEINLQIKDSKFHPNNWLPGKVKERLMRNLIHLWLADKEKEVIQGTMAPAGVASYQSIVKNHIVPFLGDFDIREIDKQVVKKFYQHLKTKSLKHKSQKNIIDSLHAFFGWALDADEDYIESIPPFPTVKVKDATPQQATDTESQEQALQRIPEEHRAIFELEIDLCLRPGEVSTLKVKDYVPERRSLWIRRTESRRIIKENTKGNKKVLLPMGDRALANVHKQAYNRFGDEWLFVDPENGKRYTEKKLRVIWKKYSGLQIKHYEGTRHTSLTQLAEELGDAFLLQDIARHSDIATTRKYIHGRQNRIREALNNRGKVLPAVYPQKGEK